MYFQNMHTENIMLNNTANSTLRDLLFIDHKKGIQSMVYEI